MSILENRSYLDRQLQPQLQTTSQAVPGRGCLVSGRGQDLGGGLGIFSGGGVWVDFVADLTSNIFFFDMADYSLIWSN